MAAGGAFERELSKQLSLWWTSDKDDNVFWRSQSSGGRATIRAKRGKDTLGHCSDLCAIDERGKPLIDLITIEAKFGRQAKGGGRASLGASVHDLLDRGPKQSRTVPYEDFIGQAVNASKRAKTPYWAVIHRRKDHQSLLVIPYRLYQELRFAEFWPVALMHVSVRGVGNRSIAVMLLGTFLTSVTPGDIKKLARRIK